MWRWSRAHGGTAPRPACWRWASTRCAACSFTPGLSEAKTAALALGHGGRSFKLWIRAEGVPVGTLVTGDGSGIEFAFAERRARMAPPTSWPSG